MYAVIKSGGKQFKVVEGEVVRLPSIQGEVGNAVDFAEVLHLGGDNPVAGSPLVDSAKVSGTIVRHGRGKKIIVYKFKRRKGYEKTRGHRQGFTDVKITGIVDNK